jgi:UDP-N-acetylglucosamine--N-acetylmuramyl-(pentapeptide) pyrophosphoryl-undecaprenol N-acetylglucosamine transferase
VKLNILISASGTGGHVIPAEKLGLELTQNPDCSKVIFAAHQIETNPYLSQKKFICKNITSAPISKKKFFSSIKAWVKGFFQSLKILKEENIHVVVGFGSYYTFPMILAAKLKKVPIVLFESNAHLGRVNKLFYKNAILTSPFPLKKDVRLVSFNNLTTHMQRMDKKEALEKLGLQNDRFTLLVFGGSQGAQFINNMMKKIAPQIAKEKMQVIHLVGKNPGLEEEMKKNYSEMGILHYVKEFEKNMSLLFSASDLAICRSGAATISELIYFELPAFLIPYPKATDNHQKKNALVFCEMIQGGMYKEEKNLSDKELFKSILFMKNNHFYHNQIHNYKKSSSLPTLEEIVIQTGKAHL